MLTISSEVNDEWLMLYNHIVFHSGLYDFDVTEEVAMKYQLRLNWLQYCLSRYEYDLRRSVNCLETIRDLLISQNKSFVLTLPNQARNSSIDLQCANETIVILERMINLNNVHQLYADKQYTELIDILKDSLMNTTKSKNTDNLVMKLGEQFEVILECFWNLRLVEECLVWCERCLKYALDQCLNASTHSQSYNEWAKCINFILIYVEAIILDESYLIGELQQVSLEQSKFYSRISNLFSHSEMSESLLRSFDSKYCPHHFQSIGHG